MILVDEKNADRIELYIRVYINETVWFDLIFKQLIYT